MLGCGGQIEEENEFGELLFPMHCSWISHDNESSFWWCDAEVDTELMKGYIFLELSSVDELAFCGENLTLNTGHELHDSLVTSLTNNHYNCIFSRETNLGNEFDWIWYNDEYRLLLAWRPEGDSEKYINLIIDHREAELLTTGSAYYFEKPI
tara:strand:- start:219 stop:674 length:456 start_codon:yes stop_codon:yes gene_type:complete